MTIPAEPEVAELVEQADRAPAERRSPQHLSFGCDERLPAACSAALAELYAEDFYEHTDVSPVGTPKYLEYHIGRLRQYGVGDRVIFERSLR